ncbi:MAG: hypothetical protein OXF66_08520 [Gammaproteobacteria bacterium]|nr:hypothetical protein [Gammaproteobacteria bacterium]MCY4165621.1 hypothetical protein [Gammaproteobacteria bacterium]MCY4254739.1 hypothetical protein [Gammaproteobacteria bacterium]MCY4341833.1 hypothetical protein [Gammaproteobacteria bacterium]
MAETAYHATTVIVLVATFNVFWIRLSRIFHLELIRFRGHLILWEGGLHDAENKTTVFTLCWRANAPKDADILFPHSERGGESSDKHILIGMDTLNQFAASAGA